VKNNKTGASLVFVLGVMMMLLAIGVSVFAAASANTGARLRQEVYHQVVLLNESVQESIFHMLTQKPVEYANPVTSTNLLTRLAWEAYRERSAEGAEELFIGLDGFEFAGSGVSLLGADRGISIASVKIHLTFPGTQIRITPARDEISIPDLDDDGNPMDTGIFVPREPKRVLVNMDIEVAVEIDAGGRSVFSSAFYKITDCVFIDNLVDSPDNWSLELIRYEKTGS
jgi:hypothetical protein